MGVARKYLCFLLQISLLLYLVGMLLYFFGKRSNQREVDYVYHKPTYDPHFADQPDSYTIQPHHLPYQLKVDLPTATNITERQAAAFIVLVRNSELSGILQSMHDVENRFNHKFNYPWIFLNDEPFTDEFQKLTTLAASSRTHYGLVNESMWGYPDWIDQHKAAERRERMKGLPYGLSESYRHMCRFQSGFFWRHPLVLSLKLEYYWRVEPDVRYYCDLDYDPFLYMKQNKKKYEHSGTIPTLWNTVKRFTSDMAKEGQIIFDLPLTDTIFNFISKDEGRTYNGCHFWTNFEIARLDLWHTEAYQRFFEYLDQTGGFFYERWGDAPVHSIFAALYLRRDEIHFFNDVGYKHSIYQHCPAEDQLIRRCSCNPEDSLDFKDHMSCLSEYMEAINYNSREDKRTVHDLLLLQ
ncbi:nucleotide-diphospho-sugar transferase [Cokeromyces recurvatus]|uniref:nucleotide-diphospho-sugar transferase n=1 Tax=Cokeromyces recurvatus TaxID=90255 RepID=UPI00221F4C0C|nr:nucleotide-diphospho-sugar transferase [Cokeromyces recurvatus]KAI7898249.1 nucleotide-diphospho-sugar transferase [Cokeromyces recurvatus]